MSIILDPTGLSREHGFRSAVCLGAVDTDFFKKAMVPADTNRV
jgi:hypothetical protein